MKFAKSLTITFSVIVTLLVTTGEPSHGQEVAKPKPWSWSVPKTHPWFGKTSAHIRKTCRPRFHIDGGIHENAYIFADPDGFYVMIVGPRVEYVDFAEFNRQHRKTDSGFTPKSPDTESWFKFENVRSGKRVKIVKWRPSPVPRAGR